MKQRSLDKLSRAEIDHAMANSVEMVVGWLKLNRISAGSTASYNVYRAVQDAIEGEWEKSRRARRGSIKTEGEG